MGHAKGEAKRPPLRPTFDRGIKFEFHGARITSDGGLLAYRELDDVLGLAEIAITKLVDGRRCKNTRHKLIGLFRHYIGLSLGKSVPASSRIAKKSHG